MPAPPVEALRPAAVPSLSAPPAPPSASPPPPPPRGCPPAEAGGPGSPVPPGGAFSPARHRRQRHPAATVQDPAALLRLPVLDGDTRDVHVALQNLDNPVQIVAVDDGAACAR